MGNNQYIIKYLRKHRFFYIFEHEQEKPVDPEKKEIWELFYYYNYFSPYEVKEFENGEVDFQDLIDLMNNRLNDMYSDYVFNAYLNGYISDSLYDEYEHDYTEWEEGRLDYDVFLRYLQVYYLWLINWWLCGEIYDEGGILPQPPENWQPQAPPPIYHFDPVVIITQDEDGNWHTIGVN